MNIKRLDSKNLNINDLAMNTELCNRICLVYNVKSGTSVNNTGYFTFYVKDELGNQIPARLFNVKDFIDKGFDAMYFKRKPVLISFYAQMYCNQWSLVIESIELYTGEFDYSKFFGKLDDIKTDQLEKIVSEAIDGYVLPDKYRTKSYTELYDGMCGGALHMFVNLVRNVLVYKYEPIDIRELVGTTVIAFDAYTMYIEKLEEFDIVLSSEIFNILRVIENKYNNCTYLEQAIDAARSIIGLTNPQNIYSHIIVSVFNTLKDNIKLTLLCRQLPKACVTRIGDKEVMRM